MGFVNDVRDKLNIRYSKVTDGVLRKIDKRDLRNGVYTVPENVHTISSDCLHGMNRSLLTHLIIPANVKIIEREAFCACDNLEILEMRGIETIGQDAFMGCEALKTISIPETAKKIELGAFAVCSSVERLEILSDSVTIGIAAFSSKNLKVVKVLDKAYECDEELKNRLSACLPFFLHAVKHGKFIPKNPQILEATNPKEIENFYNHSNEWAKISKQYTAKWANKTGGLYSERELKDGVVALYKLCTILGFFQDGISNDERIAIQKILESEMEKSPMDLHMTYSRLVTSVKGYIKDFAKFFIMNYNHNVSEGQLSCWEKEFESGRKVNYLDKAYRSWGDIKRYTNKAVLSPRETGSINNGLYPKDIINFFYEERRYENVHEGNQEMHDMVRGFGYTQEDFERLQSWYDEGKKIKPKDMVLQIAPDTFEGKGIKYEFLDKSNPEGLILGELSNCCQTVGGAGEDCVQYGATKPNSGFIKFTYNNRIIGQSWVWYNERTKMVCLDNIEIPEVWRHQFKHNPDYCKSFVFSLTRLAENIIKQMEKCGHQVKCVTVGKNYNKLGAMELFEKRNVDQKNVLPDDYSNKYSDATEYQYIISGVKFEDLYENAEEVTV